MKKLLTLVLTASLLLSCAASVFAAGSADLTLAEGSHLVLDTEKGYVDGIDGTVTVSELKANFAGNIDIAGKADDAAVATDDVIGNYKTLIYGDVNRDGKINLADVSGILQNVAGWETDVNTDAADVDKTGKINLADITKVLKYIAGWDDISLGNVRMIFENEKFTAEAEDAGIDLYFGSTMLKVGRSNTESTGMNSYKIKLARNEVESCQFFLVSNDNKEGLTAELTPFEYEYGGYTLDGELFREHYYELTHFNALIPADHMNYSVDYYPEPIVPNVTSFELSADRSQGFMINVTADENAPAGMYKATLNIKDADGKIIKTAVVYSYVWDFTLPVTPYSASAFGLNEGTLYRFTGATEENQTDIYIEYYEFLLEHNLTPSELPYDILDDRADAYMNDPRVTSFRTMGELGGYAYTDFFGEGNLFGHQWDPEVTGKKLVDTIAKVSSDPVWAYKSYFTIMDEPYDTDTFNRIKNVDDWMKGLLGDTDFNLMLCMAHNGIYSDTPFVDLVDFVQPILDIWCPQTMAYTDYYNIKTVGKQEWGSRRAYLKYGLYEDRLATVMDEGDRAWWYICCSPEYPYPNYFTNYPAIGSKLVLWQQYMFNVEGILYWDTNNEWDKIRLNRNDCSGDGQLLYWGELFGLSGPVASFRLIQIRDSFDEYDYLCMAEEVAGREAVDKILHTVTTATLDFTEDHTVMEAARDALAKLIMSK
ncbi:MAG: DUF4091 domain-containing protein [Clostridia bacterium]|nr:DUF4091 domain-containing protein [Clostridia bacterium]